MKKVTVAIPTGGKLFFETFTAEALAITDTEVVLEGITYVVGPMGKLDRPARAWFSRSSLAFVLSEPLPE